ncbi:MAG: hypothetical protein KKF41_11525 [Actinobacteria bacterium]|nr:hypothetical protein [Actinomycetota bacterium]MBU1944419.1 hypothetical protein [Actinomycetota bacterium]MBU2688205.1 hypothetical protein [Actinomycetota bacterium]
MSTIDLSPEELAQAREILEGCLGDLRAEISDTDSSSFKEQLRDRKALLESVIEKLTAAE